MPDEVRSLLRWIGTIVMVVGVLELVYGLFAAPAGTVKFQVTFLLLGCVVFFGGLRTAAVVAWLAWLALVPALGMILQIFVVMPFDLVLTSMRLNPWYMPGLVIQFAISFGVAAFLALELRRGAFIDALLAAGDKVRNMRIPLGLGALIALTLLGLQLKMLNGVDADKAKELVAAELGPQYQYYASYVGYEFGAKSNAVATVEAWNDKEIRTVPVRWEN